MRRVPLILLICLCVLAVVGCNTWERNTFNTLASAQAVINTAKADYRAGTIPQTQCAADILNKATAADTVAVNAMVVYEQEKASGGNLQAQQAVVDSALTQIAPLITAVTTLKAAACTGGA